MKIVYFFSFLLFSIYSLSAQRFGNEWINYNQQYYKMVIDSKGIYKITKSELDALGFNTNAKNPKNFQLYFRGKQIAINVIGEDDNSFDNVDYIEFYATGNNGAQDEDLYRPKKRPHPYYSLYSDETSYFLTLGNDFGKRMTQAPVVDTNLLIDKYYFAKILSVFSSEWNYDISIGFTPSLIQSYYEPFEGMVGDKHRLAVPTSATYNSLINLDGFLQNSGANVSFEALINSRRDLAKTLKYDLGNNINGTFSLNDFGAYKINKEFNLLTGTSINFNLSFVSDASSDGRNPYSVSYQLVKYPRGSNLSSPSFIDNSEYGIKLNVNGKSRLNLTSSPTKIYGYNITDFENQKLININVSNSICDIYIGDTNIESSIWLTSLLKSPKRTSVVNFQQIDRSAFDFLIITDNRIRLGADDYKVYRESTRGGSYKVLVSEIQNIYDQFNYGERSPNAIRKYIDFMTNTTQKIKYLFLIGKSISETDMLKTREIEDFVPTFGFPASDVLLTSGLLGKTETEMSIPTGRLVVSTNSEIIGYLNKVKEHESRTNSEWQKNLLHIVGPKYQSEYTTLYNTMENLRQLAITSSFGANISNYKTINKPMNDGISNFAEIPVPSDFYTKINNGVGLVSYYGHGTSTSTGYNIGYVSTQIPTGVGGKLYNNPGKYPVLLAFGCGISDSFFGEKDIASDWVNTPNKGAINAISMTYLSFEGYDTRNLETLYQTWFGTMPNARNVKSGKLFSTQSMVNEAIGNVVQQAGINNVNLFTGGDPASSNPDLYFIANLQQTILLGDPSIPVFKTNVVQPLSLKLLEVSASSKNKKNDLNWSTENEIEFDHFDIEKSEDSKLFKKIGIILGSKKSTEKNYYKFEDFNPNEGINYYRLKLIDNDGKFNYSKIVSVKYELIENKLIIKGSPIINNEFGFNLNNYLIGSAHLKNIKGKDLKIDINLINDNNYIVTVKENLPKGIYIFELKNINGIFYSHKLAKQ